MGKVVAIHQPNYLPWLGFFHKASLVDRFVFLDNVPAPQGKSWLSRNRINLNGKQVWLTVPVRKSGRSGQAIKEVEIGYERPWVRKHLGTLFQAYHRTPFYRRVMPELEEIYQHDLRFLADLNIALIESISHILDLDCQYCRASERVSAEKRKTEMIVQICKAFECQRYVTGLGSSLSFLEPGLFRAAGIELVYQQFNHPLYEHPSGVYLEGLSVLDALFCLGPKVVREHLLEQTEVLSCLEEVGHAAALDSRTEPEP